MAKLLAGDKEFYQHHDDKALLEVERHLWALAYTSRPLEKAELWKVRHQFVLDLVHKRGLKPLD